ncbi:MAG: hypothetical protein ACRER8_22190 [Pseudomonas sp.]|uniref:hypothetical protein n=1 Tax=Pseudomonas sp. TaxID=306 RepID=UPI003D6E92A2
MTNLVSLLLAERAHSAIWGAALNEMRIKRDLPPRIASRDVGTAADGDSHHAAQCATNMAIFGIPLVLPGDSISIVQHDRQTVIDVIEAERTFAIRWWTALNDLRRNDQMPGWVLNLSVGHEPDMDQWREKTSAVNFALFDTDYVRESTTTARAAAPRLKEMLT